MAEKKNQTPVYGILSLVFGALGWAVLGIVFEPLGFIFGCIGLSKNKQDVLSIIGTVLSSIGISFAVMNIVSLMR